MTRKVTLLLETDGDWEGIFIDGKLDFEDHVVDVGRLMDRLCAHALARWMPDGTVLFSTKFEFRQRQTNEAEQKVVELTGRMPKTIGDCPNGCGPAPGACHPGACACEGTCENPACHARI